MRSVPAAVVVALAVGLSLPAFAGLRDSPTDHGGGARDIARVSVLSSGWTENGGSDFNDVQHSITIKVGANPTDGGYLISFGSAEIWIYYNVTGWDYKVRPSGGSWTSSKIGSCTWSNGRTTLPGLRERQDLGTPSGQPHSPYTDPKNGDVDLGAKSYNHRENNSEPPTAEDDPVDSQDNAGDGGTHNWSVPNPQQGGE